MEVESTPTPRRRSSRYERLEQSNCLPVAAGVVGLLALFVWIVIQMSSDWLTLHLGHFWVAVHPALTILCWLVIFPCGLIVGWNIHLARVAYEEDRRKREQRHQVTLLIKDARKYRDNVDIVLDDNERVKSFKVMRSDVILETARIQHAARAAAGPRTVTQVAQPEQQKQIGPVVPRKQIVPAPYTMIDALRRFSLTEDRVFLGVDGYRDMLGCNPHRDLCHGALNASTGRGKTFTVRGLETQLLKVGCEVVHCDIKFSLIDEFGNDYRPIAKMLLNQGDMQVGNLSLPHLIIREEHAVYFLEWLCTYELKRRLRLYNQGNHSYTTFFLFLEELLYLVGHYKHLGALLAPLLSVGRSLGIKVFTAAQNFQVQNIKLNSGMRENFESAWYLGGDEMSAAALLDMTVRDLRQFLDYNHVELGKGVSVFRNNSVAYKARLLRSGLASDDFVYWLLGKADNFVLPEELLPVVEAGNVTPSGVWVPGGSGATTDESAAVGGELPMDEDLREALEAWRNGAHGPRPMQRALQCTYYRAQQLCAELVKRGLVEAE